MHSGKVLPSSRTGGGTGGREGRVMDKFYRSSLRGGGGGGGEGSEGGGGGVALNVDGD